MKNLAQTKTYLVNNDITLDFILYTSKLETAALKSLMLVSDFLCNIFQDVQEISE